MSRSVAGRGRPPARLTAAEDRPAGDFKHPPSRIAQAPGAQMTIAVPCRADGDPIGTEELMPRVCRNSPVDRPKWNR